MHAYSCTHLLTYSLTHLLTTDSLGSAPHLSRLGLAGCRLSAASVDQLNAVRRSRAAPLATPAWSKCPAFACSQQLSHPNAPHARPLALGCPLGPRGVALHLAGRKEAAVAAGGLVPRTQTRRRHRHWPCRCSTRRSSARRARRAPRKACGSGLRWPAL